MDNKKPLFLFFCRNFFLKSLLNRNFLRNFAIDFKETPIWLSW